jgi:hypothetical protein
LVQDVRDFSNSAAHVGGLVAGTHCQQPKRHTQYCSTSSKNNENYNQGDTCGSNEHLRSNCQYRDFICNFWKRPGHLQDVCRQKREEEKSISYIANSVKMNRMLIINQNTEQPFLYESMIMTLLFKIDTGATDTIINVHVSYKLGSTTLSSSKFTINCYSRPQLTVKRKRYVKVEYKNGYFNLLIIVLHGNKPFLLGLHWINMVQLDLNRIIYRSSNLTHSVPNVYTTSDQTNKPTGFRKILRKYPSISKRSTGNLPPKKLHQFSIRKTLNQFKSYQISCISCKFSRSC